VSRWIEYTADNQVIEDAGIAPRVLVPTGPSDFAQGRDRVLDWALNATRSPVSTIASRQPDSTRR
jgi:C-terminal processing protease CtpA/Prc